MIFLQKRISKPVVSEHFFAIYVTKTIPNLLIRNENNGEII